MDKREQLREIAKNNLPDSVVMQGYAENQMDLIAQVVLDIIGTLDQSTLSQDVLDRINFLKQIMEYSSIDFNNLNDPLQAYKIPMATKTKGLTRDIQSLYLNAQVREGLFGK